MGQNDIRNLISRKLVGKASIEELQELGKELRRHPELPYSMHTTVDPRPKNKPTNIVTAIDAYSKPIGRMKKLQVDGRGLPSENDEIAFHQQKSVKKKHFSAAVLSRFLVACILVLVFLFFGSDRSLLPIFANNTKKTGGKFQEESYWNIARQTEKCCMVSLRFRNLQRIEKQLTGSFKKETIRPALNDFGFIASLIIGSTITIA